MDFYQAGDSEALGFLLKRLRPRMDQVVRSKILDRELANDALQEACITIFKSANSFRGDSKVFTWIYRLLVNACIDQLRKEKIRSSQNVDDEILLTTEDSRASFEEQTSSELVIRLAMKELTTDQREAISLVWIDGFTVEETSEILGIPLGTVKSRCDRGKKALAVLLRELDPNVEPQSAPKRLKNGGTK